MAAAFAPRSGPVPAVDRAAGILLALGNGGGGPSGPWGARAASSGSPAAAVGGDGGAPPARRGGERHPGQRGIAVPVEGRRAAGVPPAARRRGRRESAAGLRAGGGRPAVQAPRVYAQVGHGSRPLSPGTPAGPARRRRLR